MASGLHQRTPYELWTGRKPDVSHIRIFGSIVMCHIPKEKRCKWDKKAEKLILIGYTDHVKGYRLYNPVTKKIITSRDVTIIEPKDDSEMMIITEQQQQQASSSDQTDHTDSDNDSTYVEEVDTTQTSSDEFYDSIPVKELKDIAESVQPEKVVRLRKKPDRYGFSNMCVDLNDDLFGDQITYEEALNGSESHEWCKAMDEELKSFKENEAWEVVERPAQATVVKCKWVFKKKIDNCEKVEKVRYRARLVAKGFTQKAGIDYKETFSPVLRYSTLRLLFALSVKYNLDMTHLDVTTAFLNGHLHETVYMSLPNYFVS